MLPANELLDAVVSQVEDYLGAGVEMHGTTIREIITIAIATLLCVLLQANKQE